MSTVVAERLVGGEVFGEDRLRLRRQAGARLGHGTPAQAMRDASICGLGQTAASAIQSAVVQLGAFNGAARA